MRGIELSKKCIRHSDIANAILRPEGPYHISRAKPWVFDLFMSTLRHRIKLIQVVEVFSGRFLSTAPLVNEPSATVHRIRDWAPSLLNHSRMCWMRRAPISLIRQAFSSAACSEADLPYVLRLSNGGDNGTSRQTGCQSLPACFLRKYPDRCDSPPTQRRQSLTFRARRFRAMLV